MCTGANCSPIIETRKCRVYAYFFVLHNAGEIVRVRRSCESDRPAAVAVFTGEKKNLKKTAYRMIMFYC